MDETVMAALQQIKQLADSGNPEALAQISQIVDGLMQGAQQPQQEQGGSFEEKLMAAQKGGGANA